MQVGGHNYVQVGCLISETGEAEVGMSVGGGELNSRGGLAGGTDGGPAGRGGRAGSPCLPVPARAQVWLSGGARGARRPRLEQWGPSLALSPHLTASEGEAIGRQEDFLGALVSGLSCREERVWGDGRLLLGT